MFTFREEIYRRVESDYIDNEFRKILTYTNKLKPTELKNTDLNTKFAKELKAIENHILRLFNAKIILKFDDASNPRTLDFGMCIFSSVQELHNKIIDAIEKNKEGFYLTECTNVLVLIDLGLLTIIKENNFNERYLSAVLFHELGHKVYCKSQRDITSNYKSWYIDINLLGIHVCVPRKLLMPVIGSILLAKNNICVYVDSEYLSDLTAVKYGYGKETYILMHTFAKIVNNNTIFKSKIHFIHNIIAGMNSSAMRRDKVLIALKNELNDKNNSKEEKAIIKKTIEELEKVQEEDPYNNQ